MCYSEELSRLILSYPEMVLGPFQAAYFGPADYYRLCFIWSYAAHFGPIWADKSKQPDLVLGPKQTA